MSTLVDENTALKAALEKAQQRLLTESLDPQDKARERSRRKSQKHRTRVEAIKGKMQQHSEAPKPSFFATNLKYAAFTAFCTLQWLSYNNS